MQYHLDAMDDGSDSPDNRLTRWIIPALIASLLLHGGLFLWARNYRIDRLSDGYYERIVPRTFHLERAEIDPKLLEPENAEVASHALVPVPVDIPDEPVSLGKNTAPVLADPKIPKLDQALLQDKPTVGTTTYTDTILAGQGSSGAVPKNDAIEEALLKDMAGATGTQMDKFASPGQISGSDVVHQGQVLGEAQPGFSNLDDLLAQTGPLSPETAPILMPTDLLYDYDQANLRPEALTSLSKLGELISRNPKSRFLIEGHSDSFGSDEYNLALSSRRAEAVKGWLVSTMTISPDRIETKGFGKSRLLAPASGTIEAQQINRRVEIVILAPDTASP